MPLTLNDEEVNLLYEYFIKKAGYISHSNKWAGVHRIIARLDEELNGKREFKKLAASDKD
jgi:hypothetical protein